MIVFMIGERVLVFFGRERELFVSHEPRKGICLRIRPTQKPFRLPKKSPLRHLATVENEADLLRRLTLSIVLDAPILKCQNPKCEPDTELHRFEISTVHMSMWECPKCKTVYFFSHADQQLSEGIRPKSE